MLAISLSSVPIVTNVIRTKNPASIMRTLTHVKTSTSVTYVGRGTYSTVTSHATKCFTIKHVNLSSANTVMRVSALIPLSALIYSKNTRRRSCLQAAEVSSLVNTAASISLILLIYSHIFIAIPGKNRTHVRFAGKNLTTRVIYDNTSSLMIVQLYIDVVCVRRPSPNRGGFGHTLSVMVFLQTPK